MAQDQSKIRDQSEMAKYLSQIFADFEFSPLIDFAYLGGSWAENRQTKLSDIDVFCSIPSMTELSEED